MLSLPGSLPLFSYICLTSSAGPALPLLSGYLNNMVRLVGTGGEWGDQGLDMFPTVSHELI